MKKVLATITNDPMGEAMRTLWFVCVLAVMSVVACGGKNEAVRDIEVVIDTDVVVLDEEPVTDTGGGTDADIKPVAEGPGGEQQWFGVMPTGQAKCYDNEKEISCPEPGERFYGQDAQFNQWKARSLLQNEDDGDVPPGTVFDDVTRLYWEQAYLSGVTWSQAQNYCSSLSLAGKSWRLPTPHELKSLIDYGSQTHPATDFPADTTKELGPCYDDHTCDPGRACLEKDGKWRCYSSTPNDWFWSSMRVQDPLTAWVVYFHDGYLEYTARDNVYSVRCVSSL